MKNSMLPNVDKAIASLLETVEPLKRVVTVLLEDADNRVLSKNVVAPMDYPHYDQCILDGYVLRALDTVGCGEGSERVLRVTTDEHIASGCCVLAHTGSALPGGADALLPLEDAKERDGCVLVSKEVTKHQWIWPRGGGLARGDCVNKEGLQLKPVDIAMLAKLGVGDVEVYDRPRVLIVPTGDECVKRGDQISPGFVYETNGLMCSLLVERYGGCPTLHEIVPDDETQLKEVLMDGTDYDLIITIGGSSKSKRDLMEQVISSMGEVLFHGVALHPGNHMGTGLIRNGEKTIPVIFLPGYTESCAVAAFMFVDAVVKKLGHYPPSSRTGHQAQLIGRATASLGVRGVRKVNIHDGKARPIKMLGESNLMGKYGYIMIPEDRAGLEAGEFVEIIYFE
ncbi:MAG TPA: molybdopterin molybdotransferase MoeA [Syntrophorhabdaceae bacterium]|nr:molybdopterin molybdotransferase MoeA [Syntrophorhabdaceae bacterium]